MAPPPRASLRPVISLSNPDIAEADASHGTICGDKGACLVSMPHWTGDQAATVQAIAAVVQTFAAILALAIAVGVPMAQRRGEKRQREDGRRAQAAALVCIVTPDLIALRESIDGVDRELASSVELLRHLGLTQGLPTLAKPAELVAHLDRIHLVGAVVAMCVMRLFRTLDQFNAAGRADQRLALVPELRERLERLMDALSQVWPGDLLNRESGPP